MDRRIVPFRSWHYHWLAERDAAEGLLFRIDDRLLGQIEREYSRSWIVDGSPVACIGLIRQWEGRHTAWAYVARGTRSHMPWITATALDLMLAKSGRIEFTVRADFKPGQRWAKRLGFKVEAPRLEKYGPEGEDHIGYVRII